MRPWRQEEHRLFRPRVFPKFSSYSIATVALSPQGGIPWASAVAGSLVTAANIEPFGKIERWIHDANAAAGSPTAHAEAGVMAPRAAALTTGNWLARQFAVVA